MACSDTTINCNITSSGCTDLLGCNSGICADFALKRHDTKPDFKLNLSDCDGPVDLTELIAEAVVVRKLESTAYEIMKSIHPHPTMSEAFKGATEAAYGEAVDL